MKTLKTGLFLLLMATLGVAQPTPGSLWEPYNELGDFFPSYALAVNSLPDSATTDNEETNIGDPNGLIGIVFTPDRDNTRISLQMTCSAPSLFGPVTLDVTLPEADEEYRITPGIAFDRARLALIKQPMTVSITYTVSVNGKRLPPRTVPLRVRSINECPMIATDPDDESSMDWTLAGYVSEELPVVKEVLDEALRKKYVDSFVGYQGDDISVYRQVLAVWRVLQERGIHYTNLDPNAGEGTRDVPLQRVQFPDESLRSPQASCADGAVVMASIFRKIGLSPVLVVLPGHRLVGIDLDAGGEKQVYLETTLLGVVPDYAPASGKQLTDDLRAGSTDGASAAAIASLVAALDAGNQTVAQNQFRLQNATPGYATVVVDEARQAGIVAIRAR